MYLIMLIGIFFLVAINARLIIDLDWIGILLSVVVKCFEGCAFSFRFGFREFNIFQSMNLISLRVLIK